MLCYPLTNNEGRFTMDINKNLTLEAGTNADFAEVFEDMQTHFREDELKPYEKFISLIDNNKYTFLHVKDGDKKVGYVLLFIEHGSKFIWPQYFVIKKEFQSMGYGTKTLKALVSFFPDMNGIFFELEPEDETSPNTIKRIKFYEKNGVKKLNLKYLYPNKEGGRKMYLFFLPIKKDFSALTKKEILAVIKKGFEYLHDDIAEINQIYEKISSS